MATISFSDVMSCVSNRWSPEIGDDSVMGWVTVAAYALAALSCFATARVRLRDRRFWVFLGVLLAFLCLNKQLDLQSALTATARCISQLQGWYADRRKVQLVFVLGLLMVSAAVFIFAARRLAPALGRVGVALAGFGILLTFVAVRAAGMHHFDAFIGYRIGGARMNWIMELSGIALIQINAVAAFFGRQRRDASRQDKPPFHRTHR